MHWNCRIYINFISMTSATSKAQATKYIRRVNSIVWIEFELVKMEQLGVLMN